MQAISTKYLGATDYRPSRIKATAGNGQTLTISYPHEFDSERAHAQAALALVHKLGWDSMDHPHAPTELVAGGTQDGYCFVFARNSETYLGLYRFENHGTPADLVKG